MKTQDSFWIFTHLGLTDAIVCNALFRHYAELHKDKIVIIPCYERNLSSIQWMLSDVPNIFFYPIESEQQLLTCKQSIQPNYKLCLGFHSKGVEHIKEANGRFYAQKETFNPLPWDSEFYRQAGLDPELKWKGFKLPVKNINLPEGYPVYHDDEKMGFIIKREHIPNGLVTNLGTLGTLDKSAQSIYRATEIHCIDSSMLNLADLMETPYCKRFVFHRYARKGLPPKLKKNWEIID